MQLKSNTMLYVVVCIVVILCSLLCVTEAWEESTLPTNLYLGAPITTSLIPSRSTTPDAKLEVQFRWYLEAPVADDVLALFYAPYLHMEEGGITPSTLVAQRIRQTNVDVGQGDGNTRPYVAIDYDVYFPTDAAKTNQGTDPSRIFIAPQAWQPTFNHLYLLQLFILVTQDKQNGVQVKQCIYI
eukprot:UN02231